MPISFYLCLYFTSFVGTIGIIRFRQLITPLRYVESYIIITAISGWIEHIMASYFNIRNLWLFHFTTFVELLLLSIVFYSWRTSKRNGALIRWSFYFYLVVWIVSKFTFEPITMMAHYTVYIAQCIQIGFSAWLMITVLQENAIRLKDDPRIWVTSGIILYNTATLFLFGLFDVMLVRSPQVLKIIWHINWYAIIIVFGLFLRSFFCKPETTSQDFVVGVTGDLRNQKTG